MQPLVSVLITSYNREQYLAEAIESVINSSYKNLEIIIGDDASEDNTVAIAKSYAAKDARVNLYFNNKNIGDYPNRNKAASYATGDYLMFVDSDDVIYAKSIEICVGLMLQYSEVSFGTYYREPAPTAFVLDSTTALHRHFFEVPYLMIGPGGTIIKRSFFNTIGGYPEKYGPANDMYFNIKASCATPVLMIPTELYFLRKHAGQEINNSYSYLFNNYRYNRDVFDELPLPFDRKAIQWLQKKNKRRFLVNICKHFFKTKNLASTKYAIKQAEYSFRDALQAIFH